MRAIASRLSLCVLLLASAATGTGCAVKSLPAAPVLEVYRIGAPDNLTIRILPDPAIVQEDVVVRPDGRISVNLIGDVQAAGRTTEEVAADIQQRIARYKRSANVTVSVDRARASSVVIFKDQGEGQRIELDKETRVIEAIAQAGGTTLFSRRGKTRLIRFNGTETEVIRINLAAIQRGNLSTNIVLVGGDIIVIPPTVLARFGYFMQALLYPFNGLTGAATSTAGLIVGF